MSIYTFTHAAELEWADTNMIIRFEHLVAESLKVDQPSLYASTMLNSISIYQSWKSGKFYKLKERGRERRKRNSVRISAPLPNLINDPLLFYWLDSFSPSIHLRNDTRRKLIDIVFPIAWFVVILALFTIYYHCCYTPSHQGSEHAVIFTSSLARLV